MQREVTKTLSLGERIAKAWATVCGRVKEVKTVFGLEDGFSVMTALQHVVKGKEAEMMAATIIKETVGVLGAEDVIEEEGEKRLQCLEEQISEKTGERNGEVGGLEAVIRSLEEQIERLKKDIVDMNEETKETLAEIDATVSKLRDEQEMVRDVVTFFHPEPVEESTNEDPNESEEGANEGDDTSEE